MRNLTVIKIGGALADRPAAMAAFWEGVQVLRASAPVVVVHGGGKQATDLAQTLGYEPQFVNGRRVTSALDLSIAQWTTRGELNTRLVAAALQKGIPAIGISGVDGATLKVKRRPPWEIDGEEVDFGLVGDVEGVDGALLTYLVKAHYLPIVAPLGLDAAAQVYNVNADTVAVELAAALEADQVLFVTAAGGVCSTSGNRRLTKCDAADFAAGTSEGWIHGGMVVKLESALEALRKGVRDVYIVEPADLVKRSNATRVVN